LKGARFITREDLTTWTRKAKPQVHDVVLSRRCNPGETAFVPPILEFALGQNLVLLRSDGKKLYPPFLRWIVRGPEWWDQIQKYLNAGAIFDSLKCADIPEFELSVPPLSTQTRIAAILSALDDKIELNRQTNATLEAIAQAIFKEWFVDFRFPGAIGETQDVGVGCMNWAGLEPAPTNPIPKGWRYGQFADFVEIIGGGTPKTSIEKYWNGSIPWFSVADAPCEADVFVIDTVKKITQAGVDNSSTKLLSEGTTIISARGTVGKVALCGVPMAMNQSCYAINGKQDDLGFYTYYLTRSISLQLQQGANGSVFDTITRNTFEQLPMVLPPPRINH
jgi:type I restriction enzyme, S subunit